MTLVVLYHLTSKMILSHNFCVKRKIFLRWEKCLLKCFFYRARELLTCEKSFYIPTLEKWYKIEVHYLNGHEPRHDMSSNGRENENFTVRFSASHAHTHWTCGMKKEISATWKLTSTCECEKCCSLINIIIDVQTRCDKFLMTRLMYVAANWCLKRILSTPHFHTSHAVRAHTV